MVREARVVAQNIQNVEGHGLAYIEKPDIKIQGTSSGHLIRLSHMRHDRIGIRLHHIYFVTSHRNLLQEINIDSGEEARLAGIVCPKPVAVHILPFSNLGTLRKA